MTLLFVNLRPTKKVFFSFRFVFFPVVCFDLSLEIMTNRMVAGAASVAVVTLGAVGFVMQTRRAEMAKPVVGKTKKKRSFFVVFVDAFFFAASIGSHFAAQ